MKKLITWYKQKEKRSLLNQELVFFFFLILYPKGVLDPILLYCSELFSFGCYPNYSEFLVLSFSSYRCWTVG